MTKDIESLLFSVYTSQASLRLIRHQRSKGIERKMAASRGAVVLKTVKKIAVQLCPFESNVRSTR